MTQTIRHIYVDKDNGSDVMGDGSPQAPYQTIGKAVCDLPYVLTKDVYIHLAGSSVAYRGDALAAPHAGPGSFVVVGDDVTVLESGTITGESRIDISDSTKAWTPDEYIGKSFRFVDGDASDNYRTICRNTDTLLTLSAKFASSPASGDAYEIFEPSAEIEFSTGIVRGHTGPPQAHLGLVAEGFAGIDARTFDATIFANVKMSGVSRFDGIVAFSGVEILSAETLAAFTGYTYVGQVVPSGILTLGDADDGASAGFGWGLYAHEGAKVYFLNDARMNGYVAESLTVLTETFARVHFGSGRTFHESWSHIVASSGAHIQIGYPSGNRDMVSICEPRGGSGTSGVGTGLVSVKPGSVVEVYNWSELLATGMGFDGVYNAGVVTFPNVAGNRNPKIEVDSGSFAVHTVAGGRSVSGSDMSNSLAGGQPTNALAVGGTGGVSSFDSGSNGGIGSDGDAQIASSDNSVHVHMDDAI